VTTGLGIARCERRLKQPTTLAAQTTRFSSAAAGETLAQTAQSLLVLASDGRKHLELGVAYFARLR